jgi:NAD(P)H-dependent FMN reductase
MREVTLSFCDGRPLASYPDDTAKVVEQIAAAEAYIIGTPMYRGTYTGALKNLLDHVPVEALMGKVAGLIATGGSDHHYLGIDLGLRPLLMWFNMHLVPGSVYLRGQQIQGSDVTDEQARDYLGQLGSAVVAMQQRLAQSPMGPPPLSLMARRRA